MLFFDAYCLYLTVYSLHATFFSLASHHIVVALPEPRKNSARKKGADVCMYVCKFIGDTKGDSGYRIAPGGP